MDLNRVTTFLRVVESGTFTAAARHLQLPVSSVSRSVSKLENDLGVVLLERTTRQVSLTEAGRVYYERAREAVSGLDEATTLAGETAAEASGVVRVSAPPELAARLVWVVGEFVRLHPKVHVDVMTTARGAELVGTEVDIAIVHGRLEDSSLIVKKLGATVHRLYASAAYIERHGRPQTANELSRHRAVLYRGADGRSTWELMGPRGSENVEVRGNLSGDSFQFVLDAVADGHGIGLVPEQCLRHSSTPFVHVLPEYSALGGMQSLIHPSRHLAKRVKLLRDFLAERMPSACDAS
jgi:DNA-binding transcriptional LysR family regulator